MSTTTRPFCFLFCVFHIQKTGYEKGVASLLHDIRSNLYSSSNVSITNTLSLLLNEYTLAFPDTLDSESDFSGIFIQFSSGNFVKPLSC